MSFKTIAVVLNDPETAASVIASALALAQSHGAHLIGLHAEIIDPPTVVSPFDLPDATVIAALYESAAQRRKTVEDIFTKTMTGEGIPFEWRAVRGTSGLSSQGVVEACRVADLVIAAQPQAGRVSEIDDILFESGRPVLFIPYITKSFKNFERVLVAWDGSRESTRAVFDSLPLFRAAREVEIFSVDPADTPTQSGALTGADLAETLARHGLKVDVNTQDSNKIATPMVLENRCSDFSADLLVMGAYSHARIRERLFGGTTQILLESMTVPVLMSR